MDSTGRQACRDPRASQEREEKTVCLENPAPGEKLGSRAWRADLERRERPVSRELQGSRACGARKDSREREVGWASRD